MAFLGMATGNSSDIPPFDASGMKTCSSRRFTRDSISNFCRVLIRIADTSFNDFGLYPGDHRPALLHSACHRSLAGALFQGWLDMSTRQSEIA